MNMEARLARLFLEEAFLEDDDIRVSLFQLSSRKKGVGEGA